MTVAERIELAFRVGYSAGYDAVVDDRTAAHHSAWEAYKRAHDVSEPGTATCFDCTRPLEDYPADTCTSRKWHREG